MSLTGHRLITFTTSSTSLAVGGCVGVMVVVKGRSRARCSANVSINILFQINELNIITEYKKSFTSKYEGVFTVFCGLMR